jgi:CelD/BcsL family acetyltransferase involved in cellulose biosynthesis
LQRADRSFDSPLFTSDFTRAVAQVRDDVEVAVLEADGQCVGFFPFQRGHNNVGFPVAGAFSDFHGVVLKAGVTFDPHWLIQQCGLRAWYFDHVLAGQTIFTSCRWNDTWSTYVDTSQGFDSYRAQRLKEGSQAMRKTFQKLRKLERETSSVRFEIGATDQRVLPTLLDWASRQCRRKLLPDVFRPAWVRQLLQNLATRPCGALSGVLSALWVNDELASALYCLRSHTVMHAWVTAFNRKFAKYSPGCQLFVHVIKSARELGIERIDLGSGNERYKASLKSGVVKLAEGSVDLRVATRAVRRLFHGTERFVRQSTLGPALTTPWRLMKYVVRGTLAGNLDGDHVDASRSWRQSPSSVRSSG